MNSRPPSSITVRRAQARDADALQRLYRELTGQAQIVVASQRITAIAEQPNTHLLVGEHDNQVVGTALLSLCADIMYGEQPFAVIENIVIDSRYRSHGIGRLLMSEMENICRHNDCSKMMLLSSAHRESAHRFFVSCGFLADRKRGFVKYRSQFAL